MPGNLRLIRNTPDYLDAVAKLQGRKGGPPDPPDGNLPPGLVAHWLLDEDDGAFVHSEQNSLPAGLLVKGPVWVDGYLGSALQFPGKGAHVDFGQVDILEEQAQLTVCMWLKTDATKNGRLLSQHTSIVLLKTTRKNSTLHLQMAQGRRVRGTTLINDGQWHHFCGVFDGDHVELFVDGNPEASIEGRRPQTKRFGRKVALGKDFRGEIDDVQIHQRALTSSEIAQLAQIQPD